MAYALAPAYRLTHDRDSGVAGRTDRTVPFVPVRFRLESGDGKVRALSWGVARETALLPILLSISLDAALTTLDATPVDRTLRLRVAVDTKAGPFVYADQMTGPRAKELALMTANALTGLIAQNEYEEPDISGVDVSIVSTPGERRLRILEAALSTRKAAPGETLHADRAPRRPPRRGAKPRPLAHRSGRPPKAARSCSSRTAAPPPVARASRPSLPSRAASLASATRSRRSSRGTGSPRSCSFRHGGRRRETGP